MTRKIKAYLSLMLLVVFVIPQLTSSLHYVEYHDFSRKQTDDKRYWIPYKYHHICEHQTLKLPSFTSFDFPFTTLLPYPQFKDTVPDYSKIIWIDSPFTQRCKRGPPC